MSKIICIGTTKGGAGKSTLSVNLAAAAAGEGRRVLLVDTDHMQKSVMAWRGLREADNISALVLNTPKMHQDLPRLAKEYDLTIIDAGGRDDAMFRNALVTCDRLVIPVKPAQFDMFATADTVELVRLAWGFKEFKASFLLNELVQNSKTSSETYAALTEFEDIPIMRTRIYARTAFRKCIQEGRGVTEVARRDPKAVSEILSLFVELDI